MNHQKLTNKTRIVYNDFGCNRDEEQWRSQPEIFGGKMFDFRRSTVFCLGQWRI